MGFVVEGLGGLRIFRDNNLTHNTTLVEDGKNVRKDLRWILSPNKQEGHIL
jgi:hypothetical protein